MTKVPHLVSVLDFFSQVPPFFILVGLALFVGVLAPWALWMIWSGPRDAGAKGQLRQQESENENLRLDLHNQRTENEGLRRVHRNLETELGQSRQQADHYAGRIRRVLETEGRIWERPLDGPAPPFRPLARGTAPIICLMNLKGGVGKTTITANLGAMMARLGRRVLMVDLDFQGTLTSLCLSGRDIQSLREQRRFVQLAFGDAALDPQSIGGAMVAIGGDALGNQAALLGADEDLVNCEQRQMTRWLIGESADDVRFRLRELLHSPTVQGGFDVVLLDCPPRLTTASVNALAASDYVLIPSLLDPPSAERVPSLLAWVRRLKEQVGLCDSLAVLGVVANQVQQKNELTARERDVWKMLSQTCTDRWGAAVPHFTTTIPRREAFPRAAERHEFAALDPDLADVFESLVRELDQAMAN